MPAPKLVQTGICLSIFVYAYFFLWPIAGFIKYCFPNLSDDTAKISSMFICLFMSIATGYLVWGVWRIVSSKYQPSEDP